MTKPIETLHPQIATRWLLRLAAVVALPLSVVSFVTAFEFFRRGIANDTDGAIAAAAIGAILLTASFMGFRAADKSEINTKFANRRLNPLLRAVIILVSLVTLLVGGEYARMTIIVINQEYLHWFYSKESISTTGGSMIPLLAEFALTAQLLIGIAVFLLWFSVFHNSSARANPAEPASIDRTTREDVS